MVEIGWKFTHRFGCWVGMLAGMNFGVAGRLMHLVVRVARCLAHLAVVGILVVGPALTAPPAYAIDPPVIDPTAMPPDTVGPEGPMEQRQPCQTAFAKEGSQFGDPPWSADFLRLGEAHKYSQGEGVLVAVIDTGVNASARVPAEPGGDFVDKGDGLSDCDAHGTLIASLIAGRPGPEDRFVGVAPAARLVSIRQTSIAFSPKTPQTDPNDPNQSRPAGTVRTLARAIMLAVKLGARVINISETACLKVADRVDQAWLGAAVRSAVVDHDVVIVAAAGNTSSPNQDPALGTCTQNPAPVPSDPIDPLGWKQVKTVVTPAWYSPLVVSVGSVSKDGSPSGFSMAGPWLAAAAPGDEIVGLAGDHPVDALPGREGPVPLQGTSYSTAFVSGIAALIRSKFPDMTANQVTDRLLRTARHPGSGWDNTQGFGPVDPVAALTWDVPYGPPKPAFPVKEIAAPEPRVEPDYGPINWVMGIGVAVLIGGGAAWLLKKARAR